MKKRKIDELEDLEGEFISLFARLKSFSELCIRSKQQLGFCIVSPKDSLIPLPSQEIQSEIHKLAREYCKSRSISEYCYRYFIPPGFFEKKDCKITNTIDDYQITLGCSEFDLEWEKTTLTRGMIFCPSDGEEGGWSDWFELQIEAIRLTPLLDLSLKKLSTFQNIHIRLGQPGLSMFEEFVYEYAIGDKNLPPIERRSIEEWKLRKISWKKRYYLIADLFTPSLALGEMYRIARKRAASSRNPIVKGLLWAFASHIETMVIQNTDLTEEEKDSLISKIREVERRAKTKEKYKAQRPAICISDRECGHFLVFLINEFLTTSQKSIILVEGILFIWIAQHAAFSGIALNVAEIFDIKISEIDFKDLIIQTKRGEISITAGLSDILKTWIKISEKEKPDHLFQKISYDSLEDLITRYSTKLFGYERQLLPRDFLEKSHTIPALRISLDLRREITRQEDLVKISPYRIKSRDIQASLSKYRRSTYQK